MQHWCFTRPAACSGDAAVAERVAAVVGEYLDAARGGESAAPGPQQPLMDAGLDSLDLLKARCRGRRQQCGPSTHAEAAGAAGACRAGPDCVATAGGEPAGSEFGLALPPTLAFDFPTLEGLANYLAASLQVRLLRLGL